MKKNIITLLIFILPAFISLSLISCKKVFEVQPKSVIVTNQMYRNIYDADAAVLGIYGKFLGILDRYVILNELRGDLTDVTPNANPYLKQISTHSVTPDNPYADPRPFYSVIGSCNDALKNFKVMVAEHKMTVAQFNERYSDIGALRTWLYLQVGIQYGTIPYVTQPIENVNDLSDVSKYPRLGLTQLVDSLVSFTESLPSILPYSTGSSLLINLDGYSTQKVFIDKNCLLGDLYLWQGSWTKAATAYMEVIRIATLPWPSSNTGDNANASDQSYEYYKLGSSINPSRQTGGHWGDMFSKPYGEEYSNYEIMWDIPYDKNFSPKNPFIDLFTVTGSYLIKPSDLAINNWNAQYRTDNGKLLGTPTDLRGLGISYKMVNNLPQINKYTYNYNPLTPFETGGKIILYRGADLFLRYSEAANHDGRDRIAYSFLNDGIQTNFDITPGGAFTSSNKGRDVGQTQQTRQEAPGTLQAITPDRPLEVAPYYFDTREGDLPQYRASWYRALGIRVRASNMNVNVDSTRSFDMTVKPRMLISRDILVHDMDDLLIAEAGLETAFEGNRWGDLLRIAIRRQATEPDYLSKKIGAKFDAAHSADASAVKSRLSDPNHWYLPFKWQ